MTRNNRIFRMPKLRDGDMLCVCIQQDGREDKIGTKIAGSGEPWKWHVVWPRRCKRPTFWRTGYRRDAYSIKSRMHHGQWRYSGAARKGNRSPGFMREHRFYWIWEASWNYRERTPADLIGLA